MNNQISERIAIAESFKSIYIWKGKALKNKEKWLKWMAVFDYGFTMLLLTFLIIICLLVTFQFDVFYRNWVNAGLIVFITMALSLKAPFAYVELILKKHINKLQKSETLINEELNIEFGNIVDKFSRRNENFKAIPNIIVMIAAFLQLVEVNKYWDKFPPIILIVSLYVLGRTNYDIFKLKKNIRKVENFIP